MNYNLKNIINKTTNMHYLEVIDWIKDNSKDLSDQATFTVHFFESNFSEDEDLNEAVKQKVKEIIKYGKK